MAKGICQHYMDARLIENAADVENENFKDKGIYVLTPKGLHILERFIAKNGINAEHLLRAFATQPICLRLLHLERRPSDDEVLVGRSVMEILFKRFAGNQPNTGTGGEESLIDDGKTRPSSVSSSSSSGKKGEIDRNLGVPVKRVPNVEVIRKSPHDPPLSSQTASDIIFLGRDGKKWVRDFTTVVAKDEGAEMCAHFVRYGFIKMVVDARSNAPDPMRTVVVRTVNTDGQVVSLYRLVVCC